ncbi:MAG: DUF1848 family protein [Prevotella sp.]|nr:DUF1848 family protein [Prevotella sp.]
MIRLTPHNGIPRQVLLMMAVMAGFTAEIFKRAFGVNFKKTTHKGNRLNCSCMESRGLGDYDSCPNGCRYCYANKNHVRALQNYQHRHDPLSPLLIGHLQPDDIIKPLRQESLTDRELTLF